MFTGFRDIVRSLLPLVLFFFFFKETNNLSFRPRRQSCVDCCSLAPGSLGVAVSQGEGTATASHFGRGRETRDQADGMADPGTGSHASASFLWLPYGTGPCGLTALSTVVPAQSCLAVLGADTWLMGESCRCRSKASGQVASWSTSP